MTSSQQQPQCVSLPSSPASAESIASAAVSSSPSSCGGAYTPVLSTVKSLTGTVANNGLVRSSLSRLQSLVPERVSGAAVSAAGQAQQMSEKYAGPIVQRVDSSLNGYIVGLLSLPAYGSAKVAQADELAYALTPEALKGAYAATRKATINTVTKVKEVSGRTVETVQRVRSERSAQLKNVLSQLQAKIEALKATVAQTSTQARQAIDLQTRINELQAKVHQAIGVATEKGAQARHLSQDILSSAAELTAHLRGYVESNLSDAQRETIGSYWARVMEGVNALKDTLHFGGGSPVASPASSRSDSAASSAEAEAEAASGEQVLSEPIVQAEAEAAPAEESKTAAPTDKKQQQGGGGKKNKGGKKTAAAAASSSSAQQDDEHKQKVAAEDE